MKLSKLYCNDSRFKTVTFNPNFNIILGEITNMDDLERDSHNLGKSTLIYIIDYMLLKELHKGSFLKKKEFQNHIFYLEMELNSGKYMTIRRRTNPNTKISLKFHSNRNQDFRECYDWEYEDIPLNSSEPENNPKKIIESALSFNVLKNEGYRKTSGYFLRTQDDYQDVFKLQKHKGKDILWKPCLFELLGFSSEHMEKKYELESELETKENLVDDVKREFKIEAGDIDKINGMIEIKEEQRDKVKIWLDRFDFYNKETGISKETVEDIEKNIASINTKRYNLEYEIQQIKESLAEKVEYNLDEILQVYKEVNIFFKEELKRDYEALLEFNRRVANERIKYLQQSFKEKQDKKNLYDEKLKELNAKRSQLLGNLTETNTFDKYNKYRDDLIAVERELERHHVELESIDNVKGIQKQINAINEKLSHEAAALGEQIENSTGVYKSIRKDFHDYVETILNQSAILSLPINGNGNVDFSARFVDIDNAETAQSMGHTYRKILCACFDLAIIKNYANKSFYRMIYHDGCLESLDPRKQKKYLELVKGVSEEFNIQYIMTCLSSEIPQGEKYLLDGNNVAVRLSDADKSEGRLFGFDF